MGFVFADGFTPRPEAGVEWRVTRPCPQLPGSVYDCCFPSEAAAREYFATCKVGALYEMDWRTGQRREVGKRIADA